MGVAGDFVVEEVPKGLMLVELIEAENVPKADLLSKPDPFVK